jgi:hypothetical protein
MPHFAICCLYFCSAVLAAAVNTRYNYELFADAQQQLVRSLPAGWTFYQRTLQHDHQFSGIRLTLRGTKTIYHPLEAQELPVEAKFKMGSIEFIEVTIWPADYRPHRANVLGRVRSLGKDTDWPEPVAGNARIKITSETNFDENTTPSTWPNWQSDVIQALGLLRLAPSSWQQAREARQAAEERAWRARFQLRTPNEAIAWATKQMAKADFFPRSRPIVEQKRTVFVVYWPNATGYDAILMVKKATGLQCYFVFGGGIKRA